METQFHELLVDQLRDIYSAETQLIEAIPQMREAATNLDLREALTHHLGETREQMNRLDKIFVMLGRQSDGETCQAMRGIIVEGKKTIGAQTDADVRDAAVIASAQRVEHYEMACYGTARTFAKEMGHDDIAEILQTSLDEEGAADHKLTKIAEGGFLRSGVNKEAATV